MLSQATAHGAAVRWWMADASEADGSLLAPSVAPTALALHLGLRVLPDVASDGGPLPCPGSVATTGAACGTRGVVDDGGVHTLGCTAVRTRRHNRLRDALFAWLLGAGVPPAWLRREAHCGPHGWPVQPGPEDEREGDVAIYDPRRGAWDYLDPTVGSLTQALVSAAVRDGTTVAEAAWRRKCAEQRRRPGHDAALEAGARLVPVAFDATGNAASTGVVRH